jgi:Phosphate-selective porin O and P
MKSLSRLLVLAVALLSTSAWAVKIPVGTDSAINFSLLLQPTMQFLDGASPNGSLNTDFYVRRSRLNVTGNYGQYVAYQLQFDMPRFGLRGNFSTSAIVQDANVTVIPIPDLYIDMGLMTMPLSRTSLESSAAFQTLDLLGNAVRYNAAFNLRDVGLQVRYIGLDKKLNARVGIFTGARAANQTAINVRNNAGTGTVAAAPYVNPDGAPRLAAYAQYAILGQEAGYVFNSIYFSETPIVVVGAGMQWQPKGIAVPTFSPAVTSTGTSQLTPPDYTILAASYFIEYPFSSDLEVVSNGSYYQYRNGAINVNTGYGMSGDLGVRYGIIEPVVSAEYFSADLHTADFRRLAAGLDFWVSKHAFNIKAELARQWSGNLATAAIAPTVAAGGPQYQGTIQMQVAFQ